MSNIELDREQEWVESLKMMQGLFPKWHVTNEQLETWRMEFGMMNPVWFRESLQLVYSKYSSDHPKPKWVHQAFREVKAGRTGVPIGSSGLEEERAKQEEIEKAEYEEVAIRDRKNARQKVNTWSQSDRVKYATLFNSKFKFTNKTYDPEKHEDWSDTFCQFVCVYRNMKNENRI